VVGQGVAVVGQQVDQAVLVPTAVLQTGRNWLAMASAQDTSPAYRERRHDSPGGGGRQAEAGRGREGARGWMGLERRTEGAPRRGGGHRGGRVAGVQAQRCRGPCLPTATAPLRGAGAGSARQAGRGRAGRRGTRGPTAEPRPDAREPCRKRVRRRPALRPPGARSGRGPRRRPVPARPAERPAGAVGDGPHDMGEARQRAAVGGHCLRHGAGDGLRAQPVAARTRRAAVTAGPWPAGGPSPGRPGPR